MPNIELRICRNCGRANPLPSPYCHLCDPPEDEIPDISPEHESHEEAVFAEQELREIRYPIMLAAEWLIWPLVILACGIAVVDSTGIVLRDLKDDGQLDGSFFVATLALALFFVAPVALAVYGIRRLRRKTREFFRKEESPWDSPAEVDEAIDAESNDRSH